MIDQFWIATGVLVAISAPLFGAYWKLSNWSRSTQQTYASDIATIEARIRSSRLVPKILELFNELLDQQRNQPTKPSSEILSEPTYAERISAIAELDHEISDVKNMYRNLRDASYSLGRSLLYVGVVLLLAIPAMFFWGVSPLTDQGAGILVFGGLAYTLILICAAGIIPSLLKREKAQTDFSKKYDEITIGR